MLRVRMGVLRKEANSLRAGSLEKVAGEEGRE
jgi:hypothetical protein